MNSTVILNSSATIAIIIGGIAAVISIDQSIKSKNHRIAAERAEQNILNKLKIFDYNTILVNAKNIENKLID